MAATVYNLKSDASQSGQLLSHQNTSGQVERVIISYVRMREQTSQNGYINIKFGPNNDLIDCKLITCSAFGKNVGYIGDSQAGVSGQNMQGYGNASADELINAPTEIFLADQEYFKIDWYGPNYVLACNIVVVAEGT
tara:strand:+ start:119 stop:529 length:411 start_codon:yes stop_codon:yes gene_type:complete